MAVRANSGQEIDVDELLELKDKLLAMQVILSGCFDAKMIELREVKNDLVKRQGIVDTLDKANKVHADSVTESQKLMAEATEAMRVAKSTQEESDLRMSEAKKKETFITTDLVVRETKLQSDVNSYADKEKALRASYSDKELVLKQTYEKKNRDLLDRENVLKIGQSQLLADQNSFQEKQAKFQEKVNAIMGTK